jgi:hypothetical protein
MGHLDQIFFVGSFSRVVQEGVGEQLSTLSAYRARLGARIKLFGPLFFSWKSVSFSSLPVLLR